MNLRARYDTHRLGCGTEEECVQDASVVLAKSLPSLEEMRSQEKADKLIKYRSQRQISQESIPISNAHRNYEYFASNYYSYFIIILLEHK